MVTRQNKPLVPIPQQSASQITAARLLHRRFKQIRARAENRMTQKPIQLWQ